GWDRPSTNVCSADPFRRLCALGCNAGGSPRGGAGTRSNDACHSGHQGRKVMARTTRHVRWGLAAALVGLGLLAPSAFGSAPVEQVPGASAINDDTEAANLAAIGADGGGHARSAARIVAKSAHE